MFLVAAAAGAAAAGCQIPTPREALQTLRDPRRKPSKTVAKPPTHLLQRAAFGPTLADQAHLAELGERAWLEEQLLAPSDDNDETLALRWRLRGIEVDEKESGIIASPHELRDLSQKSVLEQLQRAAILRATYSRWQLRERLVDFWGNHFNIYARKVYSPVQRPRAAAELMYLLGQDQRRVIRKNALGNVKDLLHASMRSAAMLGYLDQQVSDQKHPNENYARELMELHTLGVGGGYSQKDVMEVARCLTGWTIEDRFLRHVGTVYFDKARHDDGEKLVLGKKIPAGGGESDAQVVLDLLVAHPSTARFLARKLVRYFYGDGEHSAALVERTIAAYSESDGEIKAMVRAILTAPELTSAPTILKRPFDYLISALRATNALTDGSSDIQDHLEHMGQPLYQWPMPDGYPDKTAAWTGSLLPRWNFALALTHGAIGSTQIDAPAAAELLVDLPEPSLKQPERIALALAAPAFQWR